MSEQHDKLTIETPELIPLEFPLAGIGSRFLAVAVDTLIQFGVTLVLGVTGIVVFAASFSHVRRAGIWVLAIFGLAYFLLQFGYFAGFEAWWNGQTPGKRHLHLRVIKDSGRPISVYDSVARNFLRIVDSLPGFYGIGIVAMLLNTENKRLGDFVAGTVVVHEKPLPSHTKVAPTAASTPGSCGYDPSRLAEEEFQLLEAFLARRGQLAPKVRREMARRVVQRVGAKLNIPEEERRNPEALIEKLSKEYRERSRFR